MNASKVCLNQSLLLALQQVAIINQLATDQLQSALGRELTTSEFGVLGELNRTNNPLSPSDLAERFQVTKSSMTGILCKLESRQFISMETDGDDLRRKHVSITDAGRETYRRLEGGVATTGGDIASQFGEAKLSALLSDLDQLKTIMIKATPQA